MSKLLTTQRNSYKWPCETGRDKPAEYVLEAFINIDNVLNNNLYIDEKFVVPGLHDLHPYFKRSDERYKDYLSKLKCKQNFVYNENHIREKLKNQTKTTEYQHKFSEHHKKEEEKKISETLNLENFKESIKRRNSIHNLWYRNPVIDYPCKYTDIRDKPLWTRQTPTMHYVFHNFLDKKNRTAYQEEICNEAKMLRLVECKPTRIGPYYNM